MITHDDRQAQDGCRRELLASTTSRQATRPACGRVAGRRRQQRGGEPAVTVVRRKCDHFRLSEPLFARPVAAAGPHRRRARFVLPADARLVRCLPADRVLVAGPQLSGDWSRGGRRGRLRQVVLVTDRRGVCGRRVRDLAAGDVGRCRRPLLCLDCGHRGLVDRAAGHLDTAKQVAAVAALHGRADAVDTAEHLPGIAGAGLRRRCTGIAAPKIGGAAVGDHVSAGGGRHDTVDVVRARPELSGRLDFTAQMAHHPRRRATSIFRQQCPIRDPRGADFRCRADDSVDGSVDIGRRHPPSADHLCGLASWCLPPSA